MTIDLPVNLQPKVLGESLQTWQAHLQGYLSEYEDKVAQARAQLAHVEALLGSLPTDAPISKGKKKEIVAVTSVVNNSVIAELAPEPTKDHESKECVIISAVVEWDEEVKVYSATCPELNFVSSCGDSHEEAISNLKDAIALMLEPLPEYLLVKKPSSRMVELAL